MTEQTVWYWMIRSAMSLTEKAVLVVDRYVLVIQRANPSLRTSGPWNWTVNNAYDTPEEALVGAGVFTNLLATNGAAIMWEPASFTANLPGHDSTSVWADAALKAWVMHHESVSL